MRAGLIKMTLREFVAGRYLGLALLVAIVPNLAAATERRRDPAFTGGDRLAFLSEPDRDHQPGGTMAPQPDVRAFDGRWIFTSAGCTNTGSLAAIIKGGRIIVRGGGGQVSPDGTLHSVGAGGGMTLTAEGHLYGDAGSGTFDRSDGCSGSWIAIKRR
jgi:hypothetical protein